MLSLAGLALVLALAVALRFYHLGKPDLWMDELGQATAMLRPPGRALFAIQKHHGATPLDYLITMGMLRFSRSAGVLRIPAALWGTLSVYWIYRLGKLFASARVGLMAAALAAVHVFLLRYSQELRFYALFVLLTLIATEMVWQAWKRRTWRAWGLYATTLVALFYTHYFGLLMAGWHGLWMGALGVDALRSHREDRLFIFRQWLTFLAAASGAALLFASWALYDLPREHGLPHAPSFNLNLHWLLQFLRVMGGRSELWWVWVGFALIGLAMAFRKKWPTGLFLASLLFLGPGIILWIDRTHSYFFHPRQVIFLLPFFLLLTAWGIDGSAQWLARCLPTSHRYGVAIGLAGAMLGAMLLISLTPLVTYYQVSQLRREDIAYQPLTDVTAWRGAAELVAANWQEDDTLVFLAIHDTASIPFYLPLSLRKQGILVKNLSELQGHLCQRASHMGGLHPHDSPGP